MLKKIAEDIWIAQAPLLPFETLATMTIVRIRQRLVVISPIKVPDEFFAEIDRLGEVFAIISPNGFHHNYFQLFALRYPNAHYAYSPAAHKKIAKRLNGLGMNARAKALDDENKSWWRNELVPYRIEGMPAVDEFVFYHVASKTLIASDLWFLINTPKSRRARVFWYLAGVKPQIPGQSRFFKFNIKQRARFENSLAELAHLNIERIIVAHENIIHGKDQCQDLLRCR